MLHVARFKVPYPTILIQHCVVMVLVAYKTIFKTIAGVAVLKLQHQSGLCELGLATSVFFGCLFKVFRVVKLYLVWHTRNKRGETHICCAPLAYKLAKLSVPDNI